MTAEWAEKEREHWTYSNSRSRALTVQDKKPLVNEYGEIKLTPTIYQDRMIQLIQDLVDNISTPDFTAVAISRLLISPKHVVACIDFLESFWAIFLSAAQTFSDEQKLGRLSDVLACLQRLPDAVNPLKETFLVDDSIVQRPIAPGEVITIFDYRLWRDLPGFGLNLRESWNGSTSWLWEKVSLEDFRRYWTNINDFLALCVHRHGKSVRAIGDCTWMGLFTIARAAESRILNPYTNDYLKGRYIAYILAAVPWILVAGPELHNEVFNKPPIPLPRGYEAIEQGVSKEVDQSRWGFWQRRFQDMAGTKGLDEETRTAAGKIADRMGQLS